MLAQVLTKEMTITQNRTPMKDSIGSLRQNRRCLKVKLTIATDLWRKNMRNNWKIKQLWNKYWCFEDAVNTRPFYLEAKHLLDTTENNWGKKWELPVEPEWPTRSSQFSSKCKLIKIAKISNKFKVNKWHLHKKNTQQRLNWVFEAIQKIF